MKKSQRMCSEDGCTRPAVYLNRWGDRKHDKHHDLCYQCWRSDRQREWARKIINEETREAA